MYTSLMLIALIGSSVPAETGSTSLAWVSDYQRACQESARMKRPLAVFLAAGEEGWGKVSKEGELGKDARTVLEQNYVSVFIDTSSEQGKRLAEQFDIPQGRGVVLSDVSGEKQAFWHAGSLSNQDLQYYLKKYADPERVVLATEMVAEARPVVSRYVAPFQAPTYVPSHTPSFAPISSVRSSGNC